MTSVHLPVTFVVLIVGRLVGTVSTGHHVSVELACIGAVGVNADAVHQCVGMKLTYDNATIHIFCQAFPFAGIVFQMQETGHRQFAFWHIGS